MAAITEPVAIIDGLDLVVSVDTAVAHLAGALGKKVWILLPFAADWRWLEKRSGTPWYPFARLFRQPALAAWEPVISAVADAIAAGEAWSPHPEDPGWPPTRKRPLRVEPGRHRGSRYRTFVINTG